MAGGGKMVRAHVVVRGRVQGVWFRGSARDRAERLGLTGWVRNRPDGSVEAVFEGPKLTVQQMILWCHQGPRTAQVTQVDQRWGEHTGEFPGFSVKF
jgi:acylphosphatase